MAASTWATNLTTFYLEGASTVTAIGTGGAGLGNPEADDYIQGANCISKAAWTNAIKGFIIDALGANFTVPTNGAIIFFARYDAAGSLATKANGGLRGIIGSTASAYYEFYIGGSDTLAFNSWTPYVIDPNTATPDATTGSPGTNERWVGLLANLPTTAGPTKGNPIKMDAIRYGRCDLEYTNGDAGNGYNTFALSEAWANDTSRRLGLLQLQNGVYLLQGFHSFGTVSTAVDFRDSNKDLKWLASGANNVSNDAVSTGFNRIEVLNASSNVVWDNMKLQALGTRARGVFVHTAGTVTFTNCQFFDLDTFTLISTSTITTSKFLRCNAITAAGSTLNGSEFLTPTVAADASALVWNVATDPTGLLDDTTFTKGTNAHHAIEFGTSSPLTINLSGISVSGFNASNGQNDSVFYIKRTTGTVTINITGGVGTFTYKTDGATVVINQTVNVTVTVQDAADNSVIQNVQTSIHLQASPFTEIMNKDTNVSGIATDTYGGSTPVNVVVKCRKAETADSPKYYATSRIEQITSGGMNILVQLKQKASVY